MDARRDDDGRQHVRQRAQGPRRRAVQRALPAARHHRGISGTRPELAGPGRIRREQLVVGRSRGPQLGRRAERRALRILSGDSAARDPDQRGDKGFRHRRAPYRRRATAAGHRVQLGRVHQPVRHLRCLKSARARLPSRWLTRLAAEHQSQYQSGPVPHFPPQAPAPEPPAPEPPPAKPASDDAGNSAAIVAAIESLAGLHQRGILSDEEFSTKKAELLSRL